MSDECVGTDGRAARLLDEAATAGLEITDLDGWNQTRLAGSLKLRREVVNAIINRDPIAEPSASRPKMVEACRKIIAFAALISRKDDAVVQRAVESAERLDDDAHAYECHKLRLRRVVEDAVGGGAFIEGMCRVGELASHALGAPPRFRIKMIGNLVTAVQRLLDKPESRSIPLDLLDHNLRRLTKAEWAARRAARAVPAASPERAKADDTLSYIRGQIGYAMVFNGLLADRRRAVRRGRRRLWRAVKAQPQTENGHWSNLLRATNDLMANRHRPAAEWAVAAVRLAEGQRHPGFAQAFTRLRENGELTTLIGFWQEKGLIKRVEAVLARRDGAAAVQAAQSRRKRSKGPTAAAILLLVSLLMAPSAARAGDGKELSRRPPAMSGQSAFAGRSFRPAPGLTGVPASTPRVTAPLPRGLTPSRLTALTPPASTPGRYPVRPPIEIGAVPAAVGPEVNAGVLNDLVAARPVPPLRRAVPASNPFGEPAEVAAARQRAKRQRLNLPPALLVAAAERARARDAERTAVPVDSGPVDDADAITLPERIGAEGEAPVKSTRRLGATPLASASDAGE